MSDDDYCKIEGYYSEFVDERKLSDVGSIEDRNLDPKELNEVFDVVSSHRRRYTLYELQENRTVELPSLAAKIAALEKNVPPGKLLEEDIRRILTRLRHTDVPRLVDAGLVEYDARSSIVRYSDQTCRMDEILDFCSRLEYETE